MVVAFASCSSNDDQAQSTAPVVQIGAPGETNRVLSSEELAELETPGYTDADVAFVHGMIGHHQQALMMTAMVDERAGRPDLPLLAERMEVSQTDEIARLESWLTARGEDLLDEHGGHGGHGEAGGLMPGMLDDAELAQLEAASGADFDMLFLQYMIRHHEGAVVMVEELLTAGFGGQEPEMFQLAQDMGIDQQVEISRMKGLLAELDPPG